MKLITKEIQERLQKNYSKGSTMDQDVVCKFFDPAGSWTWYAMNQDPKDPDYLWGIVKGFELEIGSFSLSELQSIKGPFGLGIERDLHFTPRKAQEIWQDLKNGKHV